MAIVTVVSSGILRMRQAVLLAAVMNLCGIFVLSKLGMTVAQTVFATAEFGEGRIASAALCSALASIILWAVAAWFFGIPTSESHALVAGLTGASVAVYGDFSGVGATQWKLILAALAASVALGFSMSSLCMYAAGWIEKKHSVSERFLRAAGIAGAAVTAFLHGAQDGQKFIGVFLMLALPLSGAAGMDGERVPLWMIVLCAAVMARGTSVGGARIVRTVGTEMGGIGMREGLCADAGAALSLLAMTLAGAPVSTTHVRTSAVMGASLCSDTAASDTAVMRRMLIAWIVTFPVCFAAGWLGAKLLLPLMT